MTKSLTTNTQELRLVEVDSPETAREFLRINVRVNAGNPEYIRPLDQDVNQVFDPSRNKAFRHGKAIRWVLKDGGGVVIGRIAAFANKKYRSVGDEVPVGGIGFFDCINDQPAADMLFDVARHWLMQNGMQAMDGPINFGERDTWWGLVTRGFHAPMYRMNFNPAYYAALFEAYGFRTFFDQICFGMDPQKPMSQKVQSRHAALAKDPDFTCRTLSKGDLEKYVKDFATVYNAAWAGHGGGKELKLDQVRSLFRQMKPVMDEKIIWFVYRKQDPVAMFVNLPDLNQWFRHLNGRFGPLDKLKFLWLKTTRPNTKFTGIVFGVVPSCQGLGVDSFMVGEASKDIIGKMSYTQYEMQWIGDFNPKMLNVAENLGDVQITRVLTTYRYNFDRMAAFRRHPVVS